MKAKTYEQRLQLLNITTLEKRRQRGDLIEMYKILEGRYGSSVFVSVCFPGIMNLRGHHLKLYKKPCRLNVRKYFFSQRISLWNSLPNHVVAAPPVNSFKKRLDDYMAEMDNTHKAMLHMSIINKYKYKYH